MLSIIHPCVDSASRSAFSLAPDTLPAADPTSFRARRVAFQSQIGTASPESAETALHGLSYVNPGRNNVFFFAFFRTCWLRMPLWDSTLSDVPEMAKEAWNQLLFICFVFRILSLLLDSNMFREDASSFIGRARHPSPGAVGNDSLGKISIEIKNIGSWSSGGLAQDSWAHFEHRLLSGEARNVCS